ncbi:hypothetical protein E2562_024634 [Oryza meyeriana var. granulata]|uniref:Uncharacterized protein n=1 Tax=Oryza meyeriana var. granulata TaxID=110450 RepID=A0A6G1DMU6_9ORYZ|nr:hypothetical protein E2562_024634 [Oryza meyeriana var. granulata]
MRIRRYAARLLASSTTAPSSLPPQPAAAWCHAAADDCAICELTRSASPQVPPVRFPSSPPHYLAARLWNESDALIGRAERPPVPEDQGRDIDDGPPAKKPVTGLEVTRGACGFGDAAARLEGSGKISTGDATELAARVEAPIANGAVSGQEDRVTTCLVDESTAEPFVTGVASLVIGATSEPEVSRGTSFADVAVTEERVPLVCEAAAEAGAEVSVPESTEGALPDGEGAAKLEITRGHSQESAAKMEVTKGISLVNEAAAGSELAERVSFASEHFTEPGVKQSVPEWFASLGNEGAVEPEVTGSGSLVNEATEMEVKGGPYISTRVAAEPEDTGRASACSGDDIVARSIGKSGRTDIICYSRRRGKRKLEMVEVKEENAEMDDSAICDQYDDKLASERTGPCESVTSTAVSVEIRIADIKRELEDNSSASKGKKKKGQRSPAIANRLSEGLGQAGADQSEAPALPAPPRPPSPPPSSSGQVVISTADEPLTHVDWSLVDKVRKKAADDVKEQKELQKSAGDSLLELCERFNNVLTVLNLKVNLPEHVDLFSAISLMSDLATQLEVLPVALARKTAGDARVTCIAGAEYELGCCLLSEPSLDVDAVVTHCNEDELPEEIKRRYAGASKAGFEDVS